MFDTLQLVVEVPSNSTCQKCVNQMSDMLQLVVVIINTQLTRSAQSGRGQAVEPINSQERHERAPADLTSNDVNPEL